MFLNNFISSIIGPLTYENNNSTSTFDGNNDLDGGVLVVFGVGVMLIMGCCYNLTFLGNRIANSNEHAELIEN
jgi:hypothetical protein